MVQNLKKIFIFLVFFFVPLFVFAQGFVEEDFVSKSTQESYRAEVLEVVDVTREILPPANVEHVTQTLQIKILNGNRKGEEVEFVNDFVELEGGDTFFLDHTILPDGSEYYTMREIDRLLPILVLVGIFAFAVVLFGGLQGMRSLISLAGSLLVILYVLIPALLAGYSPVLTSIIIATVVLFFAIFFVHGFTMSSLISFIGTISAVVFTGVFATISINVAKLTGFASDEVIYLHLSTGGELDMTGLLLAGIIIGALGVLDDIAVTQVSVVKELFKVGNKLSSKKIYKKALRVGKAHIGALLNTLILAYTGAALPLLLLFFQTNNSIISIVNREVFATEIIRSLVGSVGLILAVPITTWLAVTYFSKRRKEEKML
ncbi:MAG: YibE/F family protein [Candidatus Pacebacteria bacterium]|nr:YibE/F family protein [Candidatus Paceibacterota bacterium]